MMNKALVKDYDYVDYDHKSYKYKLRIEQSAMTNITGLDIDHDYFILDTNGILVVRRDYSWVSGLYRLIGAIFLTRFTTVYA